MGSNPNLPLMDLIVCMKSFAILRLRGRRVPYLGFVIAKLDQACFPHATRGYDYHVVSIGNRFDKSCRFTYTITEILWSNFSGYFKWIYNSGHRKFMSKNIIIRIELCNLHNKYFTFII